MRDQPHHPRIGFTLFEVAISLALVAVGVLSVVMLFPVGLKAQLNARFQLYAAAKAEELVEAFAQAENVSRMTDTEAPAPWEAPISRRSQAPDLECKLGSTKYGVWPLPRDLAKRLDSDNDEIKRILDEGGQIYYSQPLATTGQVAWVWSNGTSAAAPFVANECQKLVFAVTGYAQHNAMPSLPAKRWPYYTPYPSPPVHLQHRGNKQPPTDPAKDNLPSWAVTLDWPRHGGSTPSPRPVFAWEASSPPTPVPGSDPDVVVVWNAYMGDPAASGLAYGDPTANTLTYAGALPAPGNISYAGAVLYLQSALWYCQKKGVDPSAVPADPDSYLVGLAAGQRGDVVRAMRFLAHAAICITRWKTHADLTTGVDIPSNATFPGSPSPTLHLTHDLILSYHERSLRLACAFAARYPYDWSVPRPLNRTQMMDYPLIEYDLFTPPRTGTMLFEYPAVSAAQWKPLPATAVSNVGLGMMYPDPAANPLPDSTAATSQYDAVWASRTQSSGPADHVTLTARFDPAERCRMIVFWAVDWQSYVDVETAPSAPLDASKYPFLAPYKNTDGSNASIRAYRMNRQYLSDELDPPFGNPERWNLWSADISAQPDGSTPQTLAAMALTQWVDTNTTTAFKQRFSGLYGADRNLNHRLDRNPGGVPTTTRMRATEVARLLFYDPRVPLMLR